MITTKGIVKKTEVIPEKTDKDGVVKTPKLLRITLETEYDDISDADFGNLALASAHEDQIDITLNPKQLLMEFESK